ncbi:hypothetical protein N7507_009205 [Penicillium longicatenatum]|nr:hypothetical protein N7507_009205 [Penicillium longicatenatum]
MAFGKGTGTDRWLMLDAAYYSAIKPSSHKGITAEQHPGHSRGSVRLLLVAGIVHMRPCLFAW